MVKKHNIIWIYVDSVRRYHSTPEAIKNGDDRSRLHFMDEFAKESIEFLNTVTSAPSTQMSISAMAASIPSYFLASNFSDYFTDNFVTGNLTQIIKDHGYNIYGFFQSKRSREFNLNVFTNVKRDYWPKNFSHTQYWDNSDINKVIESTLQNNLNNPAFFFVNYNCRKDPQSGDKVKSAIEMFRQAGYTKDNTILVLTSDHGYPDFSKETGHPEYYIKNNLSHDLILTDDNIMIPLFIQYPGCKGGTKIETTVSSLDIFPTILDILNIDINCDIFGKSLLPLMAPKSVNLDSYNHRFFRSDCRLKKQSGKATSIRNGNWKYIYYHDDLRKKGPEEFFNIIDDPLEEKNLIFSIEKEIKKNLEIFRNEYKKSELKANKMHSDFKSVRSNFFYKAKREILFAIPFLRQEPKYIFHFLREIIGRKRITPRK